MFVFYKMDEKIKEKLTYIHHKLKVRYKSLDDELSVQTNCNDKKGY